MKKKVLVQVAPSLVGVGFHAGCKSKPQFCPIKVKRQRTAALQNLAD
jgi:hypothetical protein